MHHLVGGTLFVTLEPCNKRGLISNSHPKTPKIPCAVRCLESGIAHIYVGSYDCDKAIRGQGCKILRTGIYEFQLKGGKPMGDGLLALEEYFKEKGYIFLDEGNIRKYVIREGGIKVSRFDVDLSYEIYNLYSEFQNKKVVDYYPGSYHVDFD